jgi:hypothetical protein
MAVSRSLPMTFTSRLLNSRKCILISMHCRFCYLQYLCELYIESQVFSSQSMVGVQRYAQS